MLYRYSLRIFFFAVRSYIIVIVGGFSSFLCGSEIDFAKCVSPIEVEIKSRAFEEIPISFQVRSGNDEEVVIEKIYPSCGCTVFGDYAGTLIEKGGRKRVDGLFSPGTQSGLQEKNVLVKLKGKQDPVYIKYKFHIDRIVEFDERLVCAPGEFEIKKVLGYDVKQVELLVSSGWIESELIRAGDGKWRFRLSPREGSDGSDQWSVTVVATTGDGQRQVFAVARSVAQAP